MKLPRAAEPLLAIAAGIVAAYGFPPDAFGVATLLGIACIALRLPAVGPTMAGAMVWLFGTACAFWGLSWVSEAFMVTNPAMGWLSLAPILGLAMLLASFSAVAVYVWRRFWPNADRPGAAAFLALAVAFSIGEWLMGHLLTGFPWTTVSLAFANSKLAQSAAWFGAYGMGILLLSATLTGVGAAAAAWRARKLDRLDAGLAGAAVLALAAAWFIPAEPGPPGEPAAEWPIVRLVQGNTPQRAKWIPDNRAPILANHLALSARPAARPLAAIVWPETAMPFYVDEQLAAMAAIGAVAPAGGHVILGAPLRNPDAQGRTRYFNSLLAVDSAGQPVARYDKSHLVPGGEYMPLADYLPLDKLVPGRSSFTEGPGIATLRLPGLPPFSPLICYEVIFPGAVVRTDDRPAFLLNITNDAWYGTSAGPYQHLAISRLRAIEEGLPLLRAANTGISAAFDAQGRELARLGLTETGILDVPLPPPAPPTLYARFGDAPYALMLTLALALAFAGARPRRR